MHLPSSDRIVRATSSYACPACGGQGSWHPERQAVVCASCGTAVAAAAAAAGRAESFEFLPLLRDRPDSGRDWQPGATQVRCSACHASMQYPAYLAGRNCERCGSPALVPCDATGAPVHPSGVLPFSLAERDARARLTTWIDGQSLLSVKRSRFAVDGVRATYLPCWAFSARVRCPWRGEKTRINKDREVEQVPIGGVVECAFDDLLVPASASIPADLIRSIEPFPMADLARYDTAYLAGTHVEVYGVNLWDAWDAASARMHAEFDAALRKDAKVLSTSMLETWPEWSGERCHHVLVPAYVVDYRYGSQPYVAVVNGRTGAIAGRKPLNLGAELIVVAVALMIVVGLVYGGVQLVRWLF